MSGKLKYIYWFIAILIGLLLASDYLLLFSRRASVKRYASEIQGESQDYLSVKLHQLKSELSGAYPDSLLSFEGIWDLSRASSTQDSLVESFLLSVNVPIVSFDTQFVHCVKGTLDLVVEKISISRAIKEFRGRLLDRYPEDAVEVIKSVPDSVFWVEKEMENECSKYFADVKACSLRESRLKSLENLVRKHQEIRRDIDRSNRIAKRQVEARLKVAQSTLVGQGQVLFSENEESIYWKKLESSHVVEAGDLGPYSFSFENYEFDGEAFSRILGEAYQVQYKDNSLNTGASPYSYCYGGGNSCGGYACSEIRVKASNNSDVLVK